MKRFVPVAAGLAVALAVSALGASHADAASPVHFATPQAAMRYLADAYNRGDVVAMHHVTTPNSFKQLQGMRSEAVHLKLESCRATGHGDFECSFQHRYPASLHDNGYGASSMIVAPADRPGWYMYTLEDCG